MADSEAMLSQWQANILLCISFQKENEFSPELVSGVHTWEFHRPTIPVSCTACKKNSLRFRQEGSLCHVWALSLFFFLFLFLFPFSLFFLSFVVCGPS